jgi:hypothetical protein
LNHNVAEAEAGFQVEEAIVCQDFGGQVFEGLTFGTSDVHYPSDRCGNDFFVDRFLLEGSDFLWTGGDGIMHFGRPGRRLL